MIRARYASTVVLVRPATDGSFEILLTRRPPEMRFLGGFYVFPGGTVHSSDYSPNVLERCRGLSGEEAQTLLNSEAGSEVAVGYWTAGIREVFEEVGVLLCVDESGAQVDLHDKARGEQVEARRKSVVRGELDFGGLLEAEELFCDLSRIKYFFHRVTPEIYSMRFDTRFFLAELPGHQTALVSAEEVTHSVWMKPADALLAEHRHSFPILPPTTTVLENLSQILSWDELRRRFDLS